MSYSVVNNAVINGNNGAYDNKAPNSSVKYGRNAVSNYMGYLNEYNKPAPTIPATDAKRLLEHDKNGFAVADSTFNNVIDSFEKNNAEVKAFTDSMPPLKFEYQYMQKPETPEKMDKMALLGAAFEEMGKKISMPVEQLTQKLQEAFGDKASATAFDINGDKQIDIGEYSTSILLADMMSKDSKNIDVKNITGVINNEGQNNLTPYINANNADSTKAVVSSIHKAFDLNTAKNFFAIKPSNLAE